MNVDRHDDEKIAAELFEALGNLKAPEQVRESNRRAVHAELAAYGRVPIWRRGIYVPLPAAAAFMLMLAGLLAYQVVVTRPTTGTGTRTTVPSTTPVPRQMVSRQAVASADVDTFSQTLYLPGYGPLSSVTTEQFATEERSNE